MEVLTDLKAILHSHHTNQYVSLKFCPHKCYDSPMNDINNGFRRANATCEDQRKGALFFLYPMKHGVIGNTAPRQKEEDRMKMRKVLKSPRPKKPAVHIGLKEEKD